MTSTDFAYLLRSHGLANLCLANRRRESSESPLVLHPNWILRKKVSAPVAEGGRHLSAILTDMCRVQLGTEALRSDNDGGGGRVKCGRDLVCTDDDGSADLLHGLEDYWMAISVPDI